MQDIEYQYHTELDTMLTRPEVDAIVQLLCAEWLGWSRTDYLLHRSEPVNQSLMLRFHNALDDLLRHRPVQHIVGGVDFGGCRIAVSPAVLVPRPETEEMVDHLTDCPLLPAPPAAVADLCTGSGCIAIALKRHWPGAAVTAVDLSAAALEVARANAVANGAEVHFVRADVLNALFGSNLGRFNLVVSNPPYVRQCERAAMSRNVLDFEPAEALFVPDDDPLLFYRAIGRFAVNHLSPKGLLAVEVNEALAAQTATMLQAMGFSTQVRHDFRDKPRVVWAQFK